MFPGYDPDRRRPYSQVVYFEIDGKKYKTTYYVYNGYGGSVRISSANSDIETVETENEETSDG